MDRAVLVGINKYPYPNVLQGCVNDIADIRAEIVRSCGFDAANIVITTDEDATATAIKTKLQSVVGSLKKGDRFLFWYSGHGAQLVDGNAATDVICPVDFNFTAATSVTVGDFHKIFSKIPAGVTAVWGSDSCHSGDLEKDLYRAGVPKMFRSPNGQRKSPPAQAKHFRDISAKLPSIALMSGCESNQTSADAYFDGRHNGAFTHYFLSTHEAPGGSRTALTGLLPKVRAALKAGGYDQIPELSGTPTEVKRTFLQNG